MGIFQMQAVFESKTNSFFPPIHNLIDWFLKGQYDTSAITSQQVIGSLEIYGHFYLGKVLTIIAVFVTSNLSSFICQIQRKCSQAR